MKSQGRQYQIWVSGKNVFNMHDPYSYREPVNAGYYSKYSQ